MQQDIAKTIARGWSPELREAMALPEQARRLSDALAVAVKWMKTAREDSAELYHQAEYTRDKIEEELSRVHFDMDVADRTRLYTENSSLEDLKAMRALAVADGILEAYTILRDAPENFFPTVRPRARHEVMGALMAALDAANAEAEQAKPEPEKNTA